jgi:hypothetical protein
VAEQVCVPVGELAPKPAGLSFEEAAAQAHLETKRARGKVVVRVG